MLILTRRPKQKIMIGHDITVTVINVNGNHVVLGIEAPKDMDVHREEVYDRIRIENEEKQAEEEMKSLAMSYKTWPSDVSGDVLERFQGEPLYGN